MPSSLSTRFQVPAPGLSLQHTLSSGQTFCWQFESSTRIWRGWIANQPVELLQMKDAVEARSLGLTPVQIRHYFSLDLDWPAILKTLAADPHLEEALREVSGLRLVREPWWECTSNFICSSLKQIVQIQQINASLRNSFGSLFPRTELRGFPSPQDLAQTTEESLRQCKLGYRARHLHHAARQIAEKEFNWDDLQSLSTADASAQLQSLRGVGEKVARCILLYAGERHDAFPIDVWVERLMGDLYWKKKRRPKADDFDKLSLDLFGPNRGLAQLFLFHWFRTVKSKPGQGRNPL
jgi:N-glycosylase/DNA lyase